MTAKRNYTTIGIAAAMSLFTTISLHHANAADDVARGKYLVTIGGCSDCHTPGTFLGKPDMSKFLGGSDVGFAIPGLGVFAGANLTPDKATGLGNWTDDQIITAITTGKRPDGRILAPIMPYKALASLTKADAKAIVAYLRSIPAVQNKVAGPFGPSQKPSIFVMAVLPGEVYSSLPPPPK
jgi:mono/diheme cytochrome c family protein